MTYRVEITKTAKKELLEAYNWIRDESPNQASKWLKDIQSVIQTLKEFPLRCPLAPENDLFPIEIRQFLYGKRSGIYRILFFIQKDVVYISHIRHIARRIVEGG